MTFTITGRADHVSREQLRSFLHASLTVLAYHGLRPACRALRVSVRRRIPGTTIEGGPIGAQWRPPDTIWLLADSAPEDMLTHCVHECIHASRSFPAGTDEKCVSTLTARLKPDVARIAEVLLDGTYRRAAAVAHTQLSYVARDGDHYDPAQHRPVGVRTKYHRRGKKR